MHVGTEHHSITVCLNVEELGTSETVLRFDVPKKKKKIQGQKVTLSNFLLLRKSLINRKHTEIAMYMLIIRENVDATLF